MTDDLKLDNMIDMEPAVQTPNENPEAISITSENSVFLENEKLYAKITTFDSIRPLPKTMQEKFEIRTYLVSKINRKALKEGKWAKYKRKRQEKLKAKAKKISEMKDSIKKLLQRLKIVCNLHFSSST